eukprot:gene32186-41729_t
MTTRLQVSGDYTASSVRAEVDRVYSNGGVRIPIIELLYRLIYLRFQLSLVATVSIHCGDIGQSTDFCDLRAG